MHITKLDAIWNFLATFFKAASSALLLPLILRMLPSEEVGLYMIFLSVTFLVSLFDFGFSASFSRNLAYIFSGVRELKTEGVSRSVEPGAVDYSLLKGTIASMKWLYLRISVIVFLILSTAGTFYIHIILENYSGNKTNAFIAWGILCTINSYSLYTFYYDSLLVGRGLIKRSKQIIVFSQVVFLVSATILLLMGYGLIAIVTSQLIYVVISRSLSRKIFFTHDLRSNLNKARQAETSEVLRSITPNAIKLGLTIFGGILVQRSAVFIGSLFLPLSDIASYGLTRQIFDIMAGLAPVFVSTYIPLISKYRVEGEIEKIKSIYLKGTFISLVIFFTGFIVIYFFGNPVLIYLNSETKLLPPVLIIAVMIVTFLEMNHSSAANILLTKNEVPFFIPSVVSGIITAIILFLLLKFTELGLMSLLIAPGIVDISYQSWKWPYEVIKDLRISFYDIFRSIRSLSTTKISS